MIRILRSLKRNERGATLVEFAFAAPVLLLVVMGLLDMTYRLYATAMLQGEVQKAARDSTLESSSNVVAIAALDQRVKDGFRSINGAVTDGSFEITRRNFSDFSSAGKMEAATGPGGQCAPPVGGVPFTYFDINNSNSWDDGAIDGQGGAQDVTLYTVKVSYKALFPVNALYGASPYHTITASTVLRNQPYKAKQARNAGQTRNCS